LSIPGTDSGTAGASARRSFLGPGPWIAAAAVVLAGSLARHDAFPDPSPLYLLAVAYAAARSGPAAGLAVAAVALADAAHAQAAAGRLAVLAAAAPAVALVVGALQRRADLPAADRRRVEEGLKVSEARFRALVEQSPLSTQILAADGTTLRVNRAWERLFGIRLEDLRGYNLLTDEQLVERGQMPYIRRAFAGQGTAIPPSPYVPDRGPRAGESIWVRAFIYPVIDENGSVSEVVLVHEDITERVRAEAALRRSDARFQSFMDRLPAIAFVKDEAGRYVWGNAAWARQHTGRVADPLGLTDAELWPGPTAARFRESDRTAAAAGTTVEVIEPVAANDGSDAHWMTLKFPLDDPQGRPLVGGIALDITERVRAEEGLRRQLAFNVAVTGHMAEGLYALDRDGLVTFLNPAAERLLGWTAAELLGTPMHDMVHSRYPDGSNYPVEECPLVSAIHADRDLRGEDSFVRKDGTMFPVSYAASPIDVGGRVEGAVLSFHDITDRRRAEAALHTAKEAAEAASRAREQFLAVLSHELRTPLTPVLVGVSALLDDPTTPDSVRPTLEVARRNVDLEARLIDDLLDVTRIRQGKLRLDPVPADAHALIRQALEICRDEIASRRLSLEVDLAAPEFHVEADPARLQQIAWNLIKNAAKFTPPGGTVAVRSRNEGRGVARPALVLEVRDTGIGIEPAAVGRIFEAFDQGDPSVTGQFGGLGLGLAISRSLAVAHGGSLTAASEGRGRGATFTLDLPTVAAPAPEAAGRHEPSPDSEPARALAILLVEDNADTLRVMARLLRGRGHRVATATGVGEALDAESAGGPFDLVISDIGLPDGSGLDLMRQVRQRSGAKGIALSGYGMDDDLRRSREAGFVAHLTKPIDIHRLEEAIRQATSDVT